MKYFLSIIILTVTLFGFDFTFTRAFNLFNKGLRLEQTNPAAAERNFEKAYALLSTIKTPSSQKFYMLGVMFANGYGVPKNYQKAIKYFKLAIQYGNKRANCSLAKVYIQLHNLKKAKKYYKEAMKYSNVSNYCNTINPNILKELQ
jgi:TPR repeat protein